MIDFHAHLLPGLDDGARNLKMSAVMLAESKRQGIEISVATPHCYFNIDVKKTIKRREKAYNKLVKYVEKNKIEVPQIILGFEVYLTEEVYQVQNLEELLIQGTNTMLVEMPRGKWDDKVFARLDYVAEKGFDIVLAHPERYRAYNEEKEHDRLFDYGFAGQLNASSLINPKTRDYSYRLIKEGRIKLLASDAHNLGPRANFMEIASELISKNLGEEYLKMFESQAEHYLGLR
ncbi:MAG: hypothetical protein IKT39_00470 [Clostridia bacterium]|nr:hypothetical protein [Clostridia bacterium]